VSPIIFPNTLTARPLAWSHQVGDRHGVGEALVRGSLVNGLQLGWNGCVLFAGAHDAARSWPLLRAVQDARDVDHIAAHGD
jgi:hypothetical protein